MIRYLKGDLLKVEEGIIAHGCNAQGVMGSGVALAIREKYPQAYEDYRKFCSNRPPESIMGYSVMSTFGELAICNMITQLIFGRDPNVRYVSYDAIDTCFRDLIKSANIHDPENQVVIHIPKIGAGLGNGDWEVISRIIERRSKDRPIFCWEL